VVECIAQSLLYDTLRFGGRELVLGLADEFRFAHEDRQHGRGRDHDIVGGDDGAALVADEFRISLQAAR
jgi:hypothetical protein